MTEGTCIVGIHVSAVVAGAGGKPRFRAFAMGCRQAGPWRLDTVWAEVDAARMDGHRCPERATEVNARVIPFDRIRTKTVALHDLDTGLRYMPNVQ